MTTSTCVRLWCAGWLLAWGVVLLCPCPPADCSTTPGPPASGQYRILDGEDAIKWLIENDYIHPTKRTPLHNFYIFRSAVMTDPTPGPRGLIGIMAHGWALTGEMKDPITDPVIIIDVPPSSGGPTPADGGKGDLVITKSPDTMMTGVRTVIDIPKNIRAASKQYMVSFTITNKSSQAITFKEGWFERTEADGRKTVDKFSFHRAGLAPGKATEGGRAVECPEGKKFKGEWRAWGTAERADGTTVKWSVSGTCGP